MAALGLLSEQPKDILKSCIAPYLTPRDLLSMAGVNRRFNQIFSDEAIWKNHVLSTRLWPHFANSCYSSKRVDQTWKQYVAEPFVFKGKIRLVERFVTKVLEKPSVYTFSVTTDLLWYFMLRLAQVDAFDDNGIKSTCKGIVGTADILSSALGLPFLCAPHLEFSCYYSNHPEIHWLAKGSRALRVASSIRMLFFLYFPSPLSLCLNKTMLFFGASIMMSKGLLGHSRLRGVISNTLKSCAVVPLYIKVASNEISRSGLLDQAKLVAGVALMAFPVITSLESSESDYIEQLSLFSGAVLLIGDNQGIKNSWNRVTQLFQSTLSRGVEKIKSGFQRIVALY